MIPVSGILIRFRRVRLPSPIFLGLLCGSAGKESACNEGDLGSTPGFGRSPGEGKGCPLQYSCLQNSMDHIGYGITKSWTRLKDFSLHFQEISPESRLDWSLPVPSGISSLKPAKTYTLAFPRSQLSPLDRKPSVVQTSSQRSRRTHRQMASLRSQVELQDHSRNQRSQPLGSAAPSFSIQRLYPDLSRKVTNRSRLTSGPSHCCSLTSLAPPLPAAGELFFPLIPA